MALPGYAAEAALYKTSRHYWVAGTAVQDHTIVTPTQFLFPGSCALDCIHDRCDRSEMTGLEFGFCQTINRLECSKRCSRN